MKKGTIKGQIGDVCTPCLFISPFTELLTAAQYTVIVSADGQDYHIDVRWWILSSQVRRSFYCSSYSVEVYIVKGASFTKFATSFTSLACWLMAVVPGVYLSVYLSTRYLHLPSIYYYTILALVTADYVISLFLVYRLKYRIHSSVRSRDGETLASYVNSNQQDERVIE